MLADILRAGFALAHRRAGLVFLDLSWKIIWAFVTAVVLLLAAWWITSDLRAIAWDEANGQNVNLMIALALLREFWNEKRGEILSILFLLMSLAAAMWIFLEAFFRRKIVRDVCAGHVLSAANAHSYPLKIFVTSAALKYGVFFASAGLMVLLAFAGAGVIAAVTVLALAFSLTLFETIIRADAVDLIGTDLFRVAGLLGILVSFEGIVVASFAGIVFAGFLSVTQPIGSLVMIGAAAAAIVFLNIFHSYLLLVRFSAIAIMRQNVVDV